nr:PREDICTED: interferon lambda-1 [Bos mutus]
MAATWTLVLVVMGLGLARARAVPTTTRKGCNTGMFKSLLPGELVAFKKEKDRNSLEDSLLQKDWDCISHLFPRTRDLKHLQSPSMCPLYSLPCVGVPHTLGARLVLTLKGPGGRDYLIPGPHPGAAPSDDTPTTASSRPPTAGCRPQGLFQHWLPQLQEAPEKSDPGKG